MRALFTGSGSVREKKKFMEFLAENFPILHEIALRIIANEVIEGNNLRTQVIMKKVFVRLWETYLKENLDEKKAEKLLKNLGVRYYKSEMTALEALQAIYEETRFRVGAKAPGQSKEVSHV